MTIGIAWATEITYNTNTSLGDWEDIVAGKNGTTLKQHRLTTSEGFVLLHTNKNVTGNNTAVGTLNASELRLISTDDFIISHSSYTITKIVYNYSQVGTQVLSTDVGDYSEDESSGIWNGSASSVSLVGGGSGTQYRITSVTITYDGGSPKCAKPTFSPEGGTYYESQNVTISCATEGATIYWGYDLDHMGSYDGNPILVNADMTLYAYAWKEGMTDSETAIATYYFRTVPNVTSIAEFNDLDDGVAFKFTGQNLVAIKQYETTSNSGNISHYLYAQDGEKGMLIFGDVGKAYNPGDVIPAGFTGIKSTYNGAPEMTNPAGFGDKTETVELVPVEYTPNNVNLDNFGRYAIIRGATVNTGTKTITTADGQSVAYYTTFLNTLIDGHTYDLSGICGYYKPNNGTAYAQFLPISATELPDYTLKGSFDGWGNGKAFEKLSTNMYLIRNVELAAGAEFKIYDKSGKWLGGKNGANYGVHKNWFRNLPLYEGQDKNFEMQDAGTYDFIIKIDDNGIAKLFVPQVSDLYLKGSFDSWGEGADFTRNEDGSYILSEIEIESASQFKIYDANGAWYPGNPSNITDDVTYVTLREDDNSNMNIPAGKWTFNIDIAKTTMVVSRILTTYRITIDPDIENGTVTADKATAAVGETVSLTIKPNAGYVVGKVNVFITETEEPIDVTDDYKFIMPDADVTVTSDFDEFEIPEGDYKKVTSAEELETGIYLIVYEDGSLAFNGGLEKLDAVGNSIEVEIKGDMIESTKTVDEATFTYDAAVKTLKSASGYYIGRTAGTNGFNASETDQYTNTITIEDGHAVITSSGGPTLQYFLSGANSRFRYYASSQKAIQLYKKTNETAPTLPDPQFDGMNPFVGTTVVTIIGGTEFGDIHYTLDGSEPTLESPLYEDVITLDKTTTVKAVVYKHIGEGVYERSAVASMEFVKAPEVENLTAFYTYENTDDAFGFTGNLVAIAQTGNYLYAQDDAKGVLIFGETGRTYIKGSKIPANFIAKKGAYHGAPQMQNPKYMMPSTEIATIEPVELTVAQASQENQEYLHRYAIINGATVTDNLITVGENSVKLYNRFGLEFSPEEGKVYNVIGVVGWDNDPEFFPLEYQEVKVPVELAGVSFGEGHNWATWIDNENYVLPVGVKAYVVTEVKNDVALVEELEDYIPAGVGVLLYSDNAMESVTADVYEGDVDDAESELKGMFEAGEVENAYLLYNNQFILAQDGTTLAAHRCYLPIPEEEVDGAPHILRIAVGGTITGVEDLLIDGNGDVLYYDLSGRCVGKSLAGKRGIFVTSDGKKVVR